MIRIGRWNLFLLLAVLTAVLSAAGVEGAGMPVDGTFRLRAKKDVLDRQLRARMTTDPEYAGRLRAATVPVSLIPGSSVVGFQVYNFSAGVYEYRPGRFVAQGTYCNLFVERGKEALYGSQTSEIFRQIVAAFDEKVFPSVCRWFGQPIIPSAFNLPDERIYIFLVDIRDSFGEGYVAGYFDHRDIEGLFGNQKPVFFMDISPGEPGSPDDKCNSFYRTLAHEFQHMVNFSIQHANESSEQERWLDEGFSMFSEYVFSGEIGNDAARIPPSPHFERFLESPGVNLISNSKESWFMEDLLFRQYGASFLFVTYLVEKYGGNSPSMQQQFTRELVRTVPKGVDGLETLIRYGGTSFAELFVNFCLALAVDDASLNNGLWGFNDKLTAFGRSSLMLPVRIGRSYAATGESSFVGGNNSVPANCLNIEEMNGKGSLDISLACEKGMTPWLATVRNDGSCQIASVSLNAGGNALLSLDFADIRRFFLLPVAVHKNLSDDHLYAYSYNTGTGSYVLYPVPSPAFAEQVMIFLKSENQSLATPPRLHINFNNLVEQLEFSPVDGSGRVFVTHYRIPGSGRGQAVCLVGDNQLSFSFSVAKLRASGMTSLEVGNSSLLAGEASDDALVMLAISDSPTGKLPFTAVAGPFDVIAGEGVTSKLGFAADLLSGDSVGLCRVNAAGIPLSWQRPLFEGIGYSAEIKGSGRYYLVEDNCGPVITTFRLAGSAIPELLFAAADDMSGIASASLKFKVDGEPFNTVVSGAFPLRVPLHGVAEGFHTFEAELADRAGNRVAAAISAQISAPVTLLQAVAYPNPCRNQTHIRVHFTGTPLFGDSAVGIYDVSGHRLVSLPMVDDGGRLAATWDLCDREGRRVGNGVYFFRVKAEAGGTLFRPTGRIAVVR